MTSTALFFLVLYCFIPIFFSRPAISHAGCIMCHFFSFTPFLSTKVSVNIPILLFHSLFSPGGARVLCFIVPAGTTGIRKAIGIGIGIRSGLGKWSRLGLFVHFSFSAFLFFFIEFQLEMGHGVALRGV
jgi:hypothetical protein